LHISFRQFCRENDEQSQSAPEFIVGQIALDLTFGLACDFPATSELFVKKILVPFDDVNKEQQRMDSSSPM